MLGAVVMLGAGCANDSAGPSRLGASAQSIGIVTPAAAEIAPRPDTARPELKKTVASRVLSAIALEKVTGRKPDPARLLELE